MNRQLMVIGFVSLILTLGGACGGSGGGNDDNGTTSANVTEQCRAGCTQVRNVCASEDVNPFTDVDSCTQQCADDDSANARKAAECLSALETCGGYAECFKEYHDDNSNNDDLTESELTQILSPIGEALCRRKAVECCSDTDNAHVFDDYDSFKNEDERVIFACQRREFPGSMEMFRITKSVNAGRIDLDQSAVDGCAQQFGSLSCDEVTLRTDFAPFYAECSALTPTVDTGGDCLTDFDCRDGFCSGAEPTEDKLGTCAAPVGEGKTCPYKSALACKDGLVCDIDTCTVPLDGGAECISDDDCASGFCQDDDTCKATTCNEQ